VINTSLKNAAAVAMCSNDHAISSDSVEYKLEEVSIDMVEFEVRYEPGHLQLIGG
jgi:hypothetical protein